LPVASPDGLLVGPLSSLPDGSSDGSLIGLLPRSFRSLVACPTARGADCSSARSSLPFVGSLPNGLLVGPAHRLTRRLTRRLARRMACRLARGES
jgi:hypothetical protein